VRAKKTSPAVVCEAATVAGSGDASADRGGVANSGVMGPVTVHHHHSPPVVLGWPRRVGVVPRRADCFQHRVEVDGLARAAAEGRAVVVCQVLAGLGGVGKTQLAADYAHRRWEERAVDLLVWTTAGSRTQILTGLAAAAVEVAGADPGDPQAAAGRLLAWLSETDRRWLVVLDDLTDPADLADLWPPDRPGGQVLVTTRRRDPVLFGPARHRVDVGVFTPAEAAAYLAATLAAHGRTEPAGELAGLAAELGCLPLALAQAAAYLLDLDLACPAYRVRLADRGRSLAELTPAALPDGQPAPVAAVWSLSIDRADQQRPAGMARSVLELAGLLDANGLPETVLTSPPARTYLALHQPKPDATTPPGTVGVDDARDALRVLHRLSLIDHDPASPAQTVRVHQLLQRAVREGMPAARRQAAARAAADALMAVWPEVERDTTLAQVLRANTDSLHTTTPDPLWQPDAHPVLFRAASSLGDAGLVTAAISRYRHLAATAAHRLGPDHPHTLTARHNLAFWRGEAGDAAGAATAVEELLADRLRVLGPNHPDTLTTRHNLAFWRGEAGDAAGAATAVEELLADRLRVLGPNHPDTLTTRNNLAAWRGEAGDAAGAATAFEELLADRLRVLGPNHPDTLTTRNNLAAWRGEAGDAAGAATAMEELLVDILRVLGPDHPHTLTTRNNLAAWRGEAGDAAGAATAFEELLADRLRVLGPNHPHTLNARNNLAYWRARAEASGNDHPQET